MTKCDFCPCSTLTKESKLICDGRSLWRCEEAIKKIMEYAELIAKANSTKTEKEKE